jgi:C1A family cysteine protease
MGEQFGYTSRSDILREEKSLSSNNAFKHATYTVSTASPKFSLFGPAHGHYDLRTKHRVTTPSDQGACGDCYAYASTAAIEYWYAHLKNYKSVPPKFSEKEVSACTSVNDEPNTRCRGGLMEYVYDYGKTFSLSTKGEYNRKKCGVSLAPSHLRINSFDVQGIEYNNALEQHIPHLLKKYGPITIGIDSDNDYIDNYVGGTFPEQHCGQDIDHAVAIVGYTDTDYIIKNSWGTDWGEDGFFRLKRGVNACGLATYVTYITDAELTNNAKWTGPYVGY